MPMLFVHGRVTIATLLTNHYKMFSPPKTRTLHRHGHRHDHRKPPPSSHKPRRMRPTKPDPNPPDPVYMRATVHAISSILRSSPWDSARDQLRRLPIRWDSYTVNCVLKTHPPMEKAWLFFNWAGRLDGFKHDHFTYTTMLDIFGEAGRLASMRHVFDEIGAKGMRVDAATYTALMHWLSKGGDFEGALRAWGEMRVRGCRPTVVSYTAFMKVLFDHGRPDEAAGVYREMLEAGLPPNCHTYTVMMDYLAGAGNFEAALEIMSEMQEAGIQPDKAACNILVEKCSRAGETSAMTRILHYMKEHSIVLRRPIFLEAMEALKRAGESDSLLREVNPHLSFEGAEEEMFDFELTATDTTTVIDRGIVLNLLARRNLIAIEHVLSGLVDKDTLLDSELISAVIQTSCANRRLSGALMAFHYSSERRKELDRSAYICLVGHLIRSNSFEKVLEVVEEMVKTGISLGTYLFVILIYRLGCAGLCSSAAKIFGSMAKDHNNVTCTAMMDAYFRAGEVDKGLEVYSNMRRQGILVSVGTFEVLVVGLEQSGWIHDAEMCRKEKKRLQWSDHSRERVSAEESLCNRLFNRDRA